MSRGQSLSDVFIFETILGASILVAEVPSGITARRATVLNIASSFGSLVGIAVNPIIGAAADVSAPLASAGIVAVLLGVAVSWIPVVNRYLDDRRPPAERDDDAD